LVRFCNEETLDCIWIARLTASLRSLANALGTVTANIAATCSYRSRQSALGGARRLFHGLQGHSSAGSGTSRTLRATEVGKRDRRVLLRLDLTTGREPLQLVFRGQRPHGSVVPAGKSTCPAWKYSWHPAHSVTESSSRSSAYLL
jgi:hypothetical protein